VSEEGEEERERRCLSFSIVGFSLEFGSFCLRFSRKASMPLESGVEVGSIYVLVLFSSNRIDGCERCSAGS